MYTPKLILIILDGWGYSPIRKGNAIWSAKTPTFDRVWSNYSHALLNAFGESVGLPWGAIGSSEVGHASIGTGMLIHQELSLIDKEIINGNFFTNKNIHDFIRDTSSKNAIHLVGLVSDGGVHSHLMHLYALLKVIKHSNYKGSVFIHAITDGRDTAPQSALQYISELQKEISKLHIDARIATVIGRYYAMDRDNHWDRTKKAYLAMTEKRALAKITWKDAINQSYKDKETDEFIKPIPVSTEKRTSLLNIFDHKPNFGDGQIRPNDRVIFFNIRPDRMRQITEMFLFPRSDTATKPIEGLKVMTLTTYNEFLPVSVPYPSQKFDHPIARILSDHGLRQGHFAETEKYAHITYFFNGGNAKAYPGEVWKLVPSPDVKTYDLKPEMSCREVTDEVLSTLKTKKLDFVLINYANSDMVGHTGVFKAVVEGIEAVDKQLTRILDEFEGKCPVIVTADHGNAECMIHPETGEIDKKHTVNPVPFILIDPKYKRHHINDELIQPMGILADVAPTALSLLNIKDDTKMTGVNLLDSLV